MTKSKRSLHWCRSISKKYLCTFYYSISQKVITLSGRRFITVSGVLLHYRAVITVSGVFYYIIGQLLQYRAFITLSVGTGAIGRYAMTALYRLFRSDGWRYCRGSIIPSNSCTAGRFDDQHFPWGTLLASFVGYSIAMAKRFLNNIIHICCNRFILLEPIRCKVFISSNIFPSTYCYLLCSVSLFLVVTMSLLFSVLTTMQNIRVSKSIGS